MAKQRKVVGIAHYPEILMARKLIRLHKLVVPFDLEKLVSKYAKVIFRDIPIEGVDGICLNLKRPGKTPVVIVNNQAIRARQKFTLAHELGHIIIPWHLGTFIDDINATKNTTANTQYWEMEREANRFASELLVPFEWIYDAFKKNPDYELLISLARSKCGISEAAARIRISHAFDEIVELELPEKNIQKLYNQTNNLDHVQRKLLANTSFHPLTVARQMTKYLSGKIAFIIEEDDKIIGTGSTEGTQSYYQAEGTAFNPHPYPNYKHKLTSTYYLINTHWWILDIEHEIADDPRSWKELLDKIVSDINPLEGADKLKRVVNGKMSGLNGTRKAKNRYTSLDEFVAEANHRFNNYHFISFIRHKDFLAFIKKRSRAFFEQ